MNGRTIANEVFSITCEGMRKTSELVAEGRHGWSDDRITDERFPLQNHAPVNRTIELVEFRRMPTAYEQVADEFMRLGLECPTYEDALYFGIQHSEELKRLPPIAFPHQPVPIVWPRWPAQNQIQVNMPSVLELSASGDPGTEEPTIHFWWFSKRPGRACTFAAIRASAKA